MTNPTYPALYSYPQELMDSVREQVEFVLPALDPDVAYTLPQLCGSEYWGRLTDGECRTAGRVMVHMVRIGLLPLEFAEAKHEYPKYYRLKMEPPRARKPEADSGSSPNCEE